MKRVGRRKFSSDTLFHIINGVLLGIMALIVIYPVYFIIIASFSSPEAVLAGKVVLFPVDINLDGYLKILERQDIWRGYLNTIIYTVLTVIFALAVTVPAGWALSRKTLPGKKLWMVFFIIPMFFGGGLIPFYNVMSSLGLVNTIWAIILPSILWQPVAVGRIPSRKSPAYRIRRCRRAQSLTPWRACPLPMSRTAISRPKLWWSPAQSSLSRTARPHRRRRVTMS